MIIRNVGARWLLLVLSPTLGFGCGSNTGGDHQSPRSTEDPAAFERAISDAQNAEEEARKAEAAALGSTTLDDLGGH